ncbi:AI-2E family transporter [Flavobacterium wongokense]|uniref:AI-2E family transporter n=1 Tax=Flavobacterium wongokense TaxID=2910674 RepID=UPI001F2A2D64|nr:AI-2E family transporter [Flavobacterium sp. WG47]MCF6132201.1 AI-2E family transporter [Flavobacterium sp. WG47]
MPETAKFPFYIKLTVILVCLISIFVIFYFGNEIISPVLLALLFAIMLRPVVNFLIKKLHFPHIIAVVFAITLFVTIFLGLFYFLSIQISEMASDWGKIKRNFLFHIEHFQQMIRDNFHLSKKEQNEIITQATSDSITSGKEIVGTTLTSFADILFNAVVVPIYTFLFLYYQTHIVTFLTKVVKPENHKKLREVLYQIKIAVQSYITGLLFEMVAVSVLTTIGLYFIGVEYFILLGIITGILNLVPYIGILFAGALSIAVSLSGSTDLSIVVGVIVVNIIVQFIDNNILVPVFVNSKVQINAIVSIIGIIIGNAWGGITGMFLAIPIIAIIKVIFDRIDTLEPWGYLFGDDLPKTYEWHKIRIPRYSYQSTTTELDVTTDIIKPEPIKETVQTTDVTAEIVPPIISDDNNNTETPIDK